MSALVPVKSRSTKLSILVMRRDFSTFSMLASPRAWTIWSTEMLEGKCVYLPGRGK